MKYQKKKSQNNFMIIVLLLNIYIGEYLLFFQSWIGPFVIADLMI
jgi:hypothetical protein